MELLNYDNEKNDNLIWYILKSLKIMEFKNNFNYDVKLVEFSSLSYEYTFYFKYINMKKMANSLWIKPVEKGKKKVIEKICF